MGVSNPYFIVVFHLGYKNENRTIQILLLVTLFKKTEQAIKLNTIFNIMTMKFIKTVGKDTIVFLDYFCVQRIEHTM